MAPTLTSESFLLTTPPRSRLPLKTSRLTVYAKRAGPILPFGLGKPKDDGSSAASEGSQNGNSSPFSFNFGKIADVKSLVPIVNGPASGLTLSPRRKDPSTVFVAGATGQAGIRIAQALLRQGFSVRAGVSDLGAAQDLARLAAQYKLGLREHTSGTCKTEGKIISKEESRRLNAVESAFKGAESIAKAIGNASKVVVTIGPAENGPTSAVSTSDALQVIQAAQLAGVGHVAIIYDGNAAGASTYNVLDGITSFFNNLFSPSPPLTIPEFLQKVIQTDVNYTFIKASLTEDFSPESSYNVVVSAEGSARTDDYKVAKSRIAFIVADVFSNTAIAENKVVEVSTNPSAPLKSVEELFSTIPEDRRRKIYAETIAKAKAEEEARVAAKKAQAAAEAAKKLEKEVQKLSNQEAEAASLAKEAEEKAEAAGTSMESLLSRAKDIGAGFSWEKLSSQIATAVQTTSEEKPKVQIATVRGQAKARSLPSQKAATKRSIPKPALKQKEEPKEKARQAESNTEVRKLFGGLFQQETIFVDED